MFWLYNIKSHFILICDPNAKIESIIERLSPSLLPTMRAGEIGCDVTARSHKSTYFWIMQHNLPPKHPL